MDSFMIHRYGDLALFAMAILLFEGLVSALNYQRNRSPALRNLILLTICASAYCMMNYVGIVYKFDQTSSLLNLVSVCLIPASSYFYIRSLQGYLHLNDRWLGYIEKVFLTIALTLVTGILCQAISGWNPLMDNVPQKTSNAFLLHVGAVGNPKPLFMLLGLTSLSSVLFMVGRLFFLMLRLDRKDPFIMIGLGVTLLVNFNDILFLNPDLVWIAPLSYLSYLVEIIRLTYQYQKEITLKIHNLEGNVIHLSKVAEAGYAIGQICHDLRSPMGVINAVADLVRIRIRKGEVDEEKIDHLMGRTKNNIDRMRKIMESCLNRLHNNEEEEPEPCTVRHLLEEARELSGPRLRDAGIDGIELTMASPDAVIVGHENDLVMSFVNLISNAADAVAGQEEPWVRVTQEVDGRQCRIRIIDSGSGLPAGMAEKIFTVNFSTKGKGKGTGLGLNFAETVLRRHKGRIVVDQACKNTCFLIELPVRPVDDVRPDAG